MSAASRSRKLNLAEREAIACGDPAVREHCLTFYQALHENAQFALKINPDAPWPFGKEIRAQCGGVRGLAAAMDGAADETTDIAATVLQGQQRFGDHRRISLFRDHARRGALRAAQAAHLMQIAPAGT